MAAAPAASSAGVCSIVFCPSSLDFVVDALGVFDGLGGCARSGQCVYDFCGQWFQGFNNNFVF